jgi:hypothetical protein
MKTIKIWLAVIVVAAITFFVIQSFADTDKPDEIKQSGNQFIDLIQHEIKALQLKPDNQFCKQYYNEVNYHIDDYYKGSRLGKSKIENDQWKENLSKQLYAAYADKFVKQAFYVFSRSEWQGTALEFIRNEYQMLQSSPFLERNSSIDRRFNEIGAILSKYDEIASFISSCRNFSINSTGLSDPFPFPLVTNNISRASVYRHTKLGNSYVNNCTRLHNELKEVPAMLFYAHVRYLDRMITSWSNMFANYSSQKAYADGLYRVVERKLDELDNNIYDLSNFDTEYMRLKQKWQADGSKAYDHFSSE